MRVSVSIPSHLCPDLLTYAAIEAADNWRGRVVRAFFWLMQAWPVSRPRPVVQGKLKPPPGGMTHEQQMAAWFRGVSSRMAAAMTAAAIREPCTHCGADVAGRPTRLLVAAVRGPVQRFCNWNHLAVYAAEQSTRGQC